MLEAILALPRTVWLLGLVSLFNDSTSELVYPLVLLFACYGLFLDATEGAEKALVADLAPKTQLGTAYGWFNLAAGIMLLPASLLFGALYQQLGAATAFTFSAACALSAAILLPSWALRDIRPIQSPRS